jgi:hypothetical protein
MRDRHLVPDHNLFRRKATPDLYCAVPEGRPVPPFIRAPEWEFAGTRKAGTPAPLGFRDRAAGVALRHMGFYAFHRIH